VQVERVLVLEVEGPSWNLEKRKAGLIVHLEKAVQPASLVDLESADKPEPKEILIKARVSSESRQRYAL
jgi:hypothetical protein